MKKYELTCLIAPDLTEGQLKEIQTAINSAIQDEEGVLGRVQDPIKKNLGGPIKKTGSAYLLTINFDSEAEKISGIENKLKALPQILRHVIIIKKNYRIKTRIKKIIKPTVEKEEDRREKKVELEEIGKKLEEILGE